MTLRAKQPEAGDWWAFRPLNRPGIPKVVRHDWPRTPIDAFILSRLEEKGLAPSLEADRRTLIRRLTFDLHGLPPHRKKSISSWESRGLTPMSGWLTASWRRRGTASAGDGTGSTSSTMATPTATTKTSGRDHAWPYRDYVIRSLNDDVPYARFVQEQIAGDVLWPGDPRGIIATGFIAAGPWDFVGHVELREGPSTRRRPGSTIATTCSPARCRPS